MHQPRNLHAASAAALAAAVAAKAPTQTTCHAARFYTNLQRGASFKHGPATRRLFSTSKAKGQAKNHVYNPVRNTDTLQTYLSTSSSSRIPLLTLWTASYCPTCRTVAPLIRSLVESGVGEEEGGVGLAEIEFDAPDIMSGDPNPAMTYMITSLPTLLSFDAGEAQTTTKVTDARSLSDRQFLVEWIRNEARRHGGRGGGGGGGPLFGGLFGR